MSYTYLLEQGEESSAENFSDIPPSVLSRFPSTEEKSCCNGSVTESCRGSQSGTTLPPSTAGLGADELMSSPAVSPAKTSAPQEGVLESKVSAVDYGLNTQEYLAKYDLNSHSLKTAQTLLFEEGTSSLVTLPDWGMMLNGECFRLAPSGAHMCDYGCSLWPTPRSGAQDNCGGSNARAKAKRCGTYVGRKQNPALSEWLMWWPIGWTALSPLETDRFRQWWRSHGEPCFRD